MGLREGWMVGGWWREKGGLELLEKEIGGNSRLLDVERCGGVICLALPCESCWVGCFWIGLGLDCTLRALDVFIFFYLLDDLPISGSQEGLCALFNNSHNYITPAVRFVPHA